MTQYTKDANSPQIDIQVYYNSYQDPSEIFVDLEEHILNST